MAYTLNCSGCVSSTAFMDELILISCIDNEKLVYNLKKRNAINCSRKVANNCYKVFEDLHLCMCLKRRQCSTLTKLTLYAQTNVLKRVTGHVWVARLMPNLFRRRAKWQKQFLAHRSLCFKSSPVTAGSFISARRAIIAHFRLKPLTSLTANFRHCDQGEGEGKTRASWRRARDHNGPMGGVSLRPVGDAWLCGLTGQAIASVAIDDTSSHLHHYSI